MTLQPPANRSLCAGALLAILASCPLLSQAAGLSISPVVIEVDTARRAVAVTVTNQGDEAVTFQTDTLVWRQVNGVDKFDPTDELLVVPPIVKIAPHSSQVFRVTLRQPSPSPIERTYRVVLEDVSESQRATNTNGGASVGFKFAHNLPVMIAPAGKINNAARWAACAPKAAAAAERAPSSPEACIRLLNAGNRRFKVRNLTVTGDDWKQDFPVKDGANILAGAEREWRIPLQAGQTGALRSVQVQTARGETLQAEAGSF